MSCWERVRQGGADKESSEYTLASPPSEKGSQAGAKPPPAVRAGGFVYALHLFSTQEKHWWLFQDPEKQSLENHVRWESEALGTETSPGVWTWDAFLGETGHLEASV